MYRRIQPQMAFMLLYAVTAFLIPPVWLICDGQFSGNYFLSSTELTYKNAKQCCYKQQMEIFRITSPKDVVKFLEAVKYGHKTSKIKRFSFWIKKDSSQIANEKEIRVAQKCPLIQWSTLGNAEPWTTYGFCGLQYHVICAPTSLKKYKAAKQGQLTFGKRRRRREEPELMMDLDERGTCSLSATLNGYYISGQKLNFESAKSCCTSKNMELVNSNFTDLEAANLKHSLCYTFRDKPQSLWIVSGGSISSSGQKTCSSIVLEDGEYLREQNTVCENLYPALCESPEEDPDICENIQYKGLEGGAYLFSNLKVPFSQASICCREQNMNLVNLYSYKESSAMYQIMLQNGLDNENLNFWTSGSRKFNSNEFRWHDGQPIVLQDFTEFCIAALEKLNAKSFMITDYGCERLLNFLCIDKDMAKDFSRKRSIHQERISTFKHSDVNDGFVTRIQTVENSTLLSRGEATLPLKKMTIVQYDLPPEKPLTNTVFRPRKLFKPKLESSAVAQEIQQISPLKVDGAKETDAPPPSAPSPQPQPNAINSIEETPRMDVFVRQSPSVTASRWQYKTCNQVKDLSPIVSISGSLSVTDALKMVMLNKLYDMKSTPSINMGSATWKKKYIDQLGRIFTEVCDDEDLISKKFINVMIGLNSIYQSSFAPGPIYDANMWDKLYKDLVNCKPKKIDLLAHAYEIYAMVEKEAFTTPDTVKQLFPPEELAEKSTDEIDPIIDSLWWMTTTAHAACYKQTPTNDSVWATQFKAAMQKDFFEPVNYRWRHPGRDNLFFGAIVGDYNLERVVRNMRYCATAAYWQSKMINRELVRGINANTPALFQVNSGRPHNQD